VLANLFFLTTGVGGWASTALSNRWSQDNRRMVEKRHGVLTEPVEIVDPSVKGVPIALGKEFNGGPDWIKSLRLKVKNKYSKTITFIGLDFDFPETSTTGIMMMHQLFIGQRSDAKFTQNNPPLSLPPNRDVEIALEPEFQSIKRLLEARNGPIENINHIVIRIRDVMFDDGTLYANGNFWQPNPDQNSPHKWVLIGDAIKP